MLFAILLACTDTDGVTPDDTAVDAVDMRLTDAPAPPEGGLQLLGPDIVVPPYTDIMYCMVGTYEGEDVGIRSYDVYQGEFGHHMVLLGTSASEIDYPDGYGFDCTELPGEIMSMAEPLILAPTFGAGDNEMTLPDGMASSLDNGQRWLVQAHYVNTSADAIRVQDVINLGFVAEDSVETWAAPYAFNTLGHSLPAAEETTYVLESDLEGTYNVLFLLGHMHEWGTKITFERVTGDTSEVLYQIDPWSAEYRDAPPVNDYRTEPLVFNNGDRLRLTCTWYNDTDAPIDFPHEMCDASGMLYPSKNAVIYTD